MDRPVYKGMISVLVFCIVNVPQLGGVQYAHNLGSVIQIRFGALLLAYDDRIITEFPFVDGTLAMPSADRVYGTSFIAPSVHSP
jgi:hypothetical protein